ncbi:MAG: response regulator transcription factor [Flavobacteriales bacterium]|nr:response regulator transcription factor [Flavobacteriales bacterium]
MSEKTIRVAIFEDNKQLRESLAFVVDGTQGFSCTGAFVDCNDLEECIEVSKPDVVLMDIEMPGMSGIEAVKIIRKKFPEVQVLMQTVFQDDENIFRAVCAGASGYILKNTSPAQYIEAIKDVCAGGSPMTGFVARRVLELFTRHVPHTEENDYQLSAREKEILQLLAQGKSYKQIAAALDLAFETVRSHMKRIYAKLHVNSNTEAVLKVLKERLV